ncbi:uncharacterized protein ARMOST_00050 [Armillaria ostoyae]|uniref:Uncharacterized protein n=1 Tax=Armillaria ostoyae TaxID=47428 RepID=A0A284QK21_ARMOS|nr:uncharacterized protein ARMOST_00050 [Armillaria ostoyae]
MTRIPGKTLQDGIASLPPEELPVIMQELAGLLDRMRSCSNPWGTRVCGVDEKDIFSRRVPSGHISACDDECSFYVTLLRAAQARDEEGLPMLKKDANFVPS